MDFDIWDECHLMWDEIQVLSLKISQYIADVGSGNRHVVGVVFEFEAVA